MYRNLKLIIGGIFSLLLLSWAHTAHAAAISMDSLAIEPDTGMAAVEYNQEIGEEILEENLAEVAEYFSRPRLVKLFSQTRKVILTFDDGPHPKTTPKILEILKKRNLKAIFFVLGLQAEKYPELVNQIAQDGHEIANHSYNHKNLAQLSEAQVNQQIDVTNDLIEKITGRKPRFLRPPYGALNKQLLRICQAKNMDIMLWTIDPKDWQHKNESIILRNLMKQLGMNGNLRGGAVLLHDIYPATVRALDPFLDQLAANEYFIADAGNFAEGDDSGFWAATAPRLIKNAGFFHKVDPKILAHPLLTSIIGEKEPVEISSMAMLKANRSNDLLVFLARNQF
jgi:peptidoglycan/xylan/chitin deacetylase (PgdA/CDA1 family)